MTTLKKYDLDGKEIGEIEIETRLTESEANPQMLKDYIVAIRNNARQWSASTKGRSEVSHSNIKPHPQKGTGRARQGTLAAPQYKGGGVVFGPKPKFNQHVRINKKERRAAVRHLLSEKLNTGNFRVVQLEGLNEPKTKRVNQFLQAIGIAGKRILFLGDSADSGAKEKCATLVKSMRNIPKVNFMSVANISGYDVLLNQEIIIMESAVEQLKGLLAV